VKLVLAAFSASLVGTKPDHMPLAMGWHGLAKVDWTTEWFLGQKWKTTVSPWAAWMLSGLKTMLPDLSPTDTTCSAAMAALAMAEAAKMVEKCIMVVGLGVWVWEETSSIWY